MNMHHYQKASANGSVQKQMKESRDSYITGRDCYSAGDHQKAYELFHRAVHLQEILFGKYHEDTVKSYWWLGKAACQTQKQPQEALKAFQRATRTGEVALGKPMYTEMCQDIEECLTNCGLVNQGSLRNAASFNSTEGSSRSLTRATSSGSLKDAGISLKGSFRRSNDSKKKLMTILMDIIANEQEGDRLFKKGKYAKANDSYAKALKLQDKTMGSDSLDGADIRCKLAYSMLKDSATKQQAAETLQMAYECYVDKVGKDHPATYGVAAKIKAIVA